MKNYIGKVKNPIAGVLPFYFFTVLPLILFAFKCPFFHRKAIGFHRKATAITVKWVQMVQHPSHTHSHANII